MENTITKKTKNTYAWAAAGQGAIYAMVTSWILRYYTDVMGLSLAFVMALTWVARIANAVADPIVGVLVDRTHTKMGKMRPYLKFTPFIISLFTFLLFMDWGIDSQLGRSIYAAVIYMLWGIAYSVADSPFWGLPCALTYNGEERDKLFSFAKFLNGIGGAIPTVVVSLLMADSILGLKRGILFSAIGIALVGLIPFAMVYPNTKEISSDVKKQNISLIKQCGLIFKNKILMIVFISGILGFGRYLIQAAYTYCAEYVFICDNAFIDSYKQVAGFALIGIGMFPTMLLAPKLIKRYSYKWLMIITGAFAAVVMTLFYIVGKATNYNFYIALVFLFLSGLPLGVFNMVVTSIVGDCVDYLEWKEGIRLEGMTASMSTFMAKIGSALSAGLIPFILLLVNYESNQVQSEEAKEGIFLLITLIPAASMLLSTIPMFFYDYVGKKREQAIEEINKKRTESEEIEHAHIEIVPNALKKD